MTVSTRVLSPQNTLADRLFATYGDHFRVVDTALIAGASVVVALSAHVSLPLPFTPVPVTGQTFAVLLTGMALGKRRGALALGLYLLEGAIGLPVFAPSASAAPGFMRLLGPTAGYLWSYPVVAALVGWLAERRWDRQPHGAAAAMSVGSFVILALGTLWLMPFVGGLVPAIEKGLLPFLPGEAVKVAFAASLLPWAWALVKRSER